MEFFFYVGGQSPIQKQYNPKVCSDMVFNSRSSPFHFLLVICPCWCLGKWATGCFYDMLDFVVLPLSTGDAAITSKQLHRVLRGAPIQSGQANIDETSITRTWLTPNKCGDFLSKEFQSYAVKLTPNKCGDFLSKEFQSYAVKLTPNKCGDFFPLPTL